MPTLPMTAFLAAAAAATLAPAAAQASPTAGPGFIGRALLRARSGPVVRPLLTAAARPVCGNSLTKAGESRSCKDEVGTTTYRRMSWEETWSLTGRFCTQDNTQVSVGPDGSAAVVVYAGEGDTRTYTQTSVAAGASSAEPLVAACRAGLR